MTDKEKKELKDGVISIFKRFNILDHTATIGGLRDDILRYINSLQEEPVIQNVITEPVGVPTGAVKLVNIPGKRSPTNEEIGDYDHKAVMESLCPQLKEKAGWIEELEAKLDTLSKKELQRLMQKYEEKCNFKEEPVSEDLKEAVDNGFK